MRLLRLELQGFKSFAKQSEFSFTSPITAIVGPNGSGKSNVVEAVRFVLGEQSMKALRSDRMTDLIFKGSGSDSGSRRASVTMVLDNSDRVFSLDSVGGSTLSLDYDEVSIGRNVTRDGDGEYTINGSSVRLKDIHALIASVHIGSSGHHIISQGEADRLLLATPKERKHILEDSLGLKTYQYRIDESKRKLERTRKNLDTTKQLLLELKPHFNYLKRQVEQLEKAEALRIKLQDFYAAYIPDMNTLLRNQLQYLRTKKESLERTLSQAQQSFKQMETLVAQQSDLEAPKPNETKDYQELVAEIKKHEQTRNALLKEEGSIEGSIRFIEQQQRRTQDKPKQVSVPVSKIEELQEGLDSVLQRIKSSQWEIVHDALLGLRSMVDSWSGGNTEPQEDHSKELQALRSQLQQVHEKKQQVKTVLVSLQQQRQAMDDESVIDQSTIRNQERELFEHRNTINQAQQEIRHTDTLIEDVGRERQRLDQEIEEGEALLRTSLKQHMAFEGYNESYDGSTFSTARENLQTHQRDLERIKIRLEEYGGGSGEDVRREYQEVEGRINELSDQILDIETTRDDLIAIIDDLEDRLMTEFLQGVDSINSLFSGFFGAMFGGGSAKLIKVTTETEEGHVEVSGIDIEVSIPRKKITSLAMLSGGERSLTSIALLFALSQINPPPFLILDETDAALDEANSKRYGDLLEQLSEYSQLVLVTHNRETMSRADILYGITIDRSGSSRLLSVKMEQALSYAK